LIEDRDVDKKYRQSIYVWLDKSNWDKFRSEIRENLPDTLDLTIGKHLGLKRLNFQVIVQGDKDKSSLSIHNVKYMRPRACKDSAYYLLILSRRIEKKFIGKLE
jgi:hypothetical protein